MNTITYSEWKDREKKIQEEKISVIVSIFNIESYLERCVKSICSQTYDNIEIILVDDGSTDKSGMLCDNLATKDSRIKVLHKENGGLSSARNYGIKYATGEYIAFVDGDDYVEPEMYEDLMRAIYSFQADLAICNYKEVGKKGIRDESSDKITIFDETEVLEVFIREDDNYRIQNAAWNKVYKKELIDGMKFPEGKLYEDIVYTTKLLARSKRAVYLDKTYYNYIFDRSDSIMNSKNINCLLTDQIPAYEEKGEFLKSIGELNFYYIHQYFFYKRMLLHYKEIKEKQPEGYRTFLKVLKKKIGKNVVWKSYKNQSKGELFRMVLFQISPALYLFFEKANETYILPQKYVKAAQKDPLVVVQLSGGMGNQMFQYALYLQLKALGKNVKIDDQTAYLEENTRPIRLQIFDVKYAIPTELEMRCLTDSYLDIVSKMRRKISGRKTAEYQEKSPLFDEKVLKKDRVYLVGCWQSEKYFSEVKEVVKKSFCFSNILISNKMKAYEEEIKKNNSVALHIRRGDYLEEEALYGGICNPQYYEKAMEQMRVWEPDCRFYIFTNDIPWAKEHYYAENITIVEGNSEDTGYIDLYLMTKCKHFILANSSFSWWGCYLGDYKAKRVIAPKQWLQGRDCRDIYTQEMDFRL